MNKKLTLFGSLIAILLVTGFGCGQKSFMEKQTERGIERISGKETDVEMEGGKVTIKDESGLVIESNAKGVDVPADFPKDIYIIDGKVVSVIRGVMGGDDLQISISTKKSIKESFEIYKEKLPAKGWIIEEALEMGEALSMMTAKKGDKGLSVSISENTEEKNGALLILSVMDYIE